MAFKIKDLMINVLPLNPLAYGCTWYSLCGPLTVGCTPTKWGPEPHTPDCLSPSDSLAALSALKEQLKRHLAEVEKQQAAAEESLLPQTVEEIDVLTVKLNDALKELQVRRAELSKKSESAGDK